MDGTLPPVASGPTASLSTITLAHQDEIIGLHPAGKLTVKLPSANRDGYEWRLSEVPDPTVLTLVENDKSAVSQDRMTPGEQTLVFQGVGPGDVDVKMWYGTLWASPMDAVRPFHFVASVTPEPKSANKSKKRSKKA